MLGTLSSSAAGRDILNRHKIYEVLFPISVMKGRDDLSNLVIKSLDYNMYFYSSFPSIHSPLPIIPASISAWGISIF